ncbi:hypothetical protein [Thalassospira alkalitolerans]|uniref:Uncharacterized protein n=1 Tax=Thalassospira alkalitolerans TaxID=1293890 RepID=A0A1Y2LGQ6_9PROT|nr:hypothetical protein [Thalassospira alkalitolerans]OSQ50038.1 hypothetical protein TALK_00580 [Thalassospira alkalitolerans]|tara:strand:- start:135875 stop:136357 length:483 start_codon:yes stop_codon:yes gene_type:complete
MTDLTIASQGFSYAAFESAAVTRLIDETAHAWLRSFKVDNPQAHQRLVNELRTALAQDAVPATEKESMQDILDQAAHDAIASWLANLSGQDDCFGATGFAMMRCAFLSANCDHIWSERFLDRDHANGDLAAALSIQMMCPTPVLKSCVMPRQSLDRRAVS